MGTFFRKIRRILFYNDFVMFLRNAWAFRRELADFRGYDYTYNLNIFCRSLELTKEFLESDKAITESAPQHAEEIADFLEDIKRFHNAYEYAEKELGYRFSDFPPKSEEEEINDKKLGDKIHEIEQNSWNKAMDNLKKNAQGWWD